MGLDHIKPYQASLNKIKTMKNTYPHIILASCNKPGFVDGVNHDIVDADYITAVRHPQMLIFITPFRQLSNCVIQTQIAFLVKIPPFVSLNHLR